jgi:hypothetical protein
MHFPSIEQTNIANKERGGFDYAARNKGTQ